MLPAIRRGVQDPLQPLEHSISISMSSGNKLSSGIEDLQCNPNPKQWVRITSFTPAAPPGQRLS
jgi:hypothetical protein